MKIEQINKLINESIKKYDLEGHETIFGGMVWFAKCLQKVECNCIDDHLKNNTYQFTTPRYDDNTEEIFNIIKNNIDIIEAKLNLNHY